MGHGQRELLWTAPSDCAWAHHHYLQNCLSKSGLVGTAYNWLFTKLFIKIWVVGVEVLLIQIILDKAKSFTETGGLK